MKRLTILGSTGSIGTQALEVARWRGFQVVGLAAGHNIALLLEQVREFKPTIVSVHETHLQEVRSLLTGLETRVVADPNEVAACESDVVVGAIPGISGLEPTRTALENGRNVALANKEAMVVAGPLIWEAASAGGARIAPVDSEHCAIAQCLIGEHAEDIEALILTASGGPFREGPADLSTVTPEMALRHPNWSMGRKVTVDSSTLMNKGLEVIEAHFLFEIPPSRIRVLIHPQSFIHSMVCFRDGQVKAQIGPADMRLPIQWGILAALEPQPIRPRTPITPLLTGKFELIEPDHTRFPCLELAYTALERGGVCAVALNAADEIAVERFLEGALPFKAIPRLIAQVIDEAPNTTLSWASIREVDLWARNRAEELARSELARRTS